MLNLTPVSAGAGDVSFACSLDLSDLDFSGNRPFRQPVKVTGRVAAVGGVVSLTAMASFTFTAPCDLCGCVVEKNFTLPFCHTVVAEAEEENDDFALAPDWQLDEEALLRDDLILWVPLRFVCKEDCKGLCPVCGCNRNEQTCNCVQKTGDSRFAALARLLEDE